MFAVTVTFEIKAGHEAEFLARMTRQAAESLAREPDCLQFDVCRPPEHAGTVFLYEIYRDEAAFQAHLESAHFKDFDAGVGPWVEAKQVQTWQRLAPAPA